MSTTVKQGWYVFSVGQAYAMETGKAPARRNAEVMLVTEVIRWRRDVERYAADRLAEVPPGHRGRSGTPGAGAEARVITGRDPVRSTWVGRGGAPSAPRPGNAVAASPEASAHGPRSRPASSVNRCRDGRLRDEVRRCRARPRRRAAGARGARSRTVRTKR